MAAALLLSVRDLSAKAVNWTRKFEFNTRFVMPGHKNQEMTLEQGAILQPIGNDPALQYQSLVLCKDATFRIDSRGESGLVPLEGFCYGVNLKVPLQGVEWRVTGLFVTEIKYDERNRDWCAPGVQAKLRQNQVRRQVMMAGSPPLETCRNDAAECRKQFDNRLMLDYGKDYNALKKDTCKIIPTYDEDGNSIRYLYCLPKENDSPQRLAKK